MSIETAVAHLEKPEAAVVERVFTSQKACLSVAALLSIAGLLAWGIPAFHQMLPGWVVMSPGDSLVSLACGVSLALSLSRATYDEHGMWRLAAAAAVALGVAAWITAGGAAALPNLFSLADYPASRPGEMTVQFASAFLLLSVLLLFLNSNRGLVSRGVDALFGVLGVAAIFLAARYIFQITHLFGTSFVDPTPVTTMTVLYLLTLVAFLSRTRHGFYDILLGAGMGGRIARPLAIAVVIMPFMREALRERLIRVHLIPEHGAAAFLAAITSLAGLLLVVLVSRYIRRMETSIQHLSLRDELTGLYNLRGFKLLAEQALLMAQRSHLPFSLLFIDVDDLKQINDRMGHGVGSAMLANTAELLKAGFREADVVGRIGGDEFAIAGQFTQQAVIEVAERLEAQALLTRNQTSHSLAISLSIGHVTAEPGTHQTLQELLEKADAVMYYQKRRKKAPG